MRKPRNKKVVPSALYAPPLDSKVGKYFIGRVKGLKKGEAALAAGYPDVYHTPQIEKSVGFQALEKKYYKDVLLGKMSMDAIANEQVKVITQDADLGAKNQAIKMALDKIEPIARIERDDEKVVVIFK